MIWSQMWKISGCEVFATKGECQCSMWDPTARVWCVKAYPEETIGSLRILDVFCLLAFPLWRRGLGWLNTWFAIRMLFGIQEEHVFCPSADVYRCPAIGAAWRRGIESVYSLLMPRYKCQALVMASKTNSIPTEQVSTIASVTETGVPLPGIHTLYRPAEMLQGKLAARAPSADGLRSQSATFSENTPINKTLGARFTRNSFWGLGHCHWHKPSCFCREF